MINPLARWALLAGIAVFGASCTVTPIFQHEHFQYTRIDSITVLPVMDNRPENTADLDTEFRRLWSEMEAAAEERGRDQVRQGSTA